MDSQFWDSIRFDLNQTSGIGRQQDRMRPFSNSYNHPYNRQVQWNFHNTNNQNSQSSSLPSMITSSEQDMAGGTVPVNVEDLKQTAATLTEDVDTLRRVISQQQQILEVLRHQHSLVTADTSRHDTAILELTSAKPSRDAWVAQADASIRSTSQQCNALHSRVEQLVIGCHDRPNREELNVAISAAVNPLTHKLEVLDSSMQRLISSPSTGVTESTINEQVATVVAEAMVTLKRDEEGQLSELRDATEALNNAKRQLISSQESLHVQTMSAPPLVNSPMLTKDSVAMEEYWNRIQTFVSSKLSDFEARINQRPPPPPINSNITSSVDEPRIGTLEKSLQAAVDSVSSLETKLEEMRSTQVALVGKSDITELRNTISVEMNNSLEASEIRKAREVTTVVELALGKESSRWERRLEEAVESAVARCRNSCSADTKYAIDRAMSNAETTATRLAESVSRANSDSLVGEVERKVRNVAEEAREVMGRGSRRMSEVEERVDRVERALRGDLQKLREDMKNESFDHDLMNRRSIEQSREKTRSESVSQATLEAAVSAVLSQVGSPQLAMRTTGQQPPPPSSNATLYSPFSSPNTRDWRSDGRGGYGPENNSNNNTYSNASTPHNNMQYAPAYHTNLGPESSQVDPNPDPSFSHFGNAAFSHRSQSQSPVVESGGGPSNQAAETSEKVHGSRNQSPVVKSGGGPSNRTAETSEKVHGSRSHSSSNLSGLQSISERSPVASDEPEEVLTHISGPLSTINSEEEVDKSPTRDRPNDSTKQIFESPTGLISPKAFPVRGTSSSHLPLRSEDQSNFNRSPVTRTQVRSISSLHEEDEDEEVSSRDRSPLSNARLSLPSPKEASKEKPKESPFVQPIPSRSPTSELEESGDSIGSDSSLLRRGGRHIKLQSISKSPPRMPRPSASLPDLRAPPSTGLVSPATVQGELNAKEEVDEAEFEDAPGPEGPPPPLANSRPQNTAIFSPLPAAKHANSSTLNSSVDSSTSSSSNSSTASSTTGSSYSSFSSSSTNSSTSSSGSSPGSIADPSGPPPSSAPPTDPNLMTAEKALVIRGSGVPSTCEFDENDPYDMTLRSEGWSKHSGKNGNPFWAAIGDAKLSTWSRPKIGELGRKRASFDLVNAVAKTGLELGFLTQKEVDDSWTLILNKSRSADALIKDWKAKEVEYKAKNHQNKTVESVVNKVPPIVTPDSFRKRETGLVHGRDRLLLQDDDEDDEEHSTLSSEDTKKNSPMSSSKSAASASVSSFFHSSTSSSQATPSSRMGTIKAGPPSARFSAFNKAAMGRSSEFGAKALAWTKEELVAHLRSKGLAPIADMFEKEVIDGKTLALMETTDLTAPAPEGFGLNESDPMFQKLWSLQSQLKAALKKSEPPKAKP